MGTALEVTCPRLAVEEARGLPAGTWLSLNASPQLATDLVELIEALEHLDRDVVLEITEHVEVADYAPLVQAIEALSRGHARFAVDDAGAGYAGLRHILEVRPQFVKLDIALVREIDLDPARRAMVASMTLFARETGCVLIAEGIETEGELAVLRDLGVTYGQATCSAGRFESEARSPASTRPSSRAARPASAASRRPGTPDRPRDR